MTDIALLLLAAGQSSRMRGRDKLLEVVDGRPLLQRMCATGQRAGLTVFVTLPAPDHPRHDVIGSATPVFVPDAALGMSASLKRGVAALPDTVSAMMVLPSDMPEIGERDLADLAEAHEDQPDKILRAASDTGRPGHPVLFPKRHFAEFAQLTGDQGARPILSAHADQVVLVPLSGAQALTDLDTPEDWDAWRAARSPSS